MFTKNINLMITFPIPHLVSISAVTDPTPPTPTTATVYSLIFFKMMNFVLMQNKQF